MCSSYDPSIHYSGHCILLTTFLYTTLVYYPCILPLYTTTLVYYYPCILPLYTTLVYYPCILPSYTTHHGTQDREGRHDFRVVPVSRLDILLFLQHRIVDVELLFLCFCTAAADVTLDTLLKLWTGTLLHKDKQSVKLTGEHTQENKQYLMMLHVGFVYLSIFVSQHIPVVLQLELTTLPELQKEHSCKQTQEDKYT